MGPISPVMTSASFEIERRIWLLVEPMARSNANSARRAWMALPMVLATMNMVSIRTVPAKEAAMAVSWKSSGLKIPACSHAPAAVSRAAESATMMAVPVMACRFTVATERNAVRMLSAQLENAGGDLLDGSTAQFAA